MQRKDISDWHVVRAIDTHKKGIRAALEGLIPHDCIRYPYEILMNWFNAPFKVAYSALERCHANGYAEYGVSLRTCWLTEKGKELLDKTWEEFKK